MPTDSMNAPPLPMSQHWLRNPGCAHRILCCLGLLGSYWLATCATASATALAAAEPMRDEGMILTELADLLDTREQLDADAQQRLIDDIGTLVGELEAIDGPAPEEISVAGEPNPAPMPAMPVPTPPAGSVPTPPSVHPWPTAAPPAPPSHLTIMIGDQPPLRMAVGPGPIAVITSDWQLTGHLHPAPHGLQLGYRLVLTGIETSGTTRLTRNQATTLLDVAGTAVTVSLGD